jgi:DNA mismatch repair ATPase MutS
LLENGQTSGALSISIFGDILSSRETKHVAEALVARVANAHFEDQFEDGRMTFDYRLHAGVAEKSNALELMRFGGAGR